MRTKHAPRQSYANEALKALCKQPPQDGTVTTADLIKCSTLWRIAEPAQQQQQQQCSQDSDIRGCLTVQVQWMPDADGQLHPYNVVPDLFESFDEESKEPFGPRWDLMLQLQQHYLQHQHQQQQCQQRQPTAEEQPQSAISGQEQQQQQTEGKQTHQQLDAAINKLLVTVADAQPTTEQQQQQQESTQDAAAIGNTQQETAEAAEAAAAAAEEAAAAAAWSAARHHCCQDCGTSHSLSWTQTAFGRLTKLQCNSCVEHYKATRSHRTVSQSEMVLVPHASAVAAALSATAAAIRPPGSAVLNMEPAGVTTCSNCCTCITPFRWSRQSEALVAAAASQPLQQQQQQQQQQQFVLCNSCAAYAQHVGKQRPVSEADKFAAQNLTQQLVAAYRKLLQQQRRQQLWVAEQQKRLQSQRERTQRSRAKKKKQQQCSRLKDSTATAAATAIKRQHQNEFGSPEEEEEGQQVKRSKTGITAAAAVQKPPRPAPASAVAAAAVTRNKEQQHQSGTGITACANSSTSSGGSGRLTPQLSDSINGASAARPCTNGGIPKPPPFKLLKRNKYLFRQRHVVEKDEISVCSCLPSNGQCCRDADDCLNRALKVCCTPGTCPAAESCQNTTLVKRKLPAVSVERVGPKGWGVLAQQDISRGTLVAEYLGEVVPVSEGVTRLAAYAAKGLQHTYLMDLSKSEVIDATMQGGMARFINHSCEPNCETQKWQDGGELVIAIVATKDIPAGTELTYDYRYESHAVPHARTRCCCGAASCSGWLGSLDPQAHLQAQLEHHHKEAAKRVVKQVDEATGEEYHVDVLDTMDSDDE